MTAMYRIPRWDFDIKIESVAAVKVTDSFVTMTEVDPWGKVRERREKREGRYFNTWIEARDALLRREQKKIEYHDMRLQKARSALGQIKSMKEPS